jgi:hypothetical protein
MPKPSFLDQLREEIRRSLNEVLFGRPLSIQIGGEKFLGLVSKNPRPGEKPYRITWFSGKSRENLTPLQPHIQISEIEAKQIVETGDLPQSVKDQLWIVFGDKVKSSIELAPA